MPGPVAARFKARGLRLLWNADSNSAGRMYGCREYCVLSDRGIYDWMMFSPEEPYRVWCACVWSSSPDNDALAQGLLRHGKKTYEVIVEWDIRSCEIWSRSLVNCFPTLWDYFFARNLWHQLISTEASYPRREDTSAKLLLKPENSYGRVKKLFCV
jgi:hypothetical protein